MFTCTFVMNFNPGTPPELTRDSLQKIPHIIPSLKSHILPMERKDIPGHYVETRSPPKTRGEIWDNKHAYIPRIYKPLGHLPVGIGGSTLFSLLSTGNTRGGKTDNSPKHTVANIHRQLTPPALLPNTAGGGLLPPTNSAHPLDPTRPSSPKNKEHTLNSSEKTHPPKPSPTKITPAPRSLDTDIQNGEYLPDLILLSSPYPPPSKGVLRRGVLETPLPPPYPVPTTTLQISPLHQTHAPSSLAPPFFPWRMDALPLHLITIISLNSPRVLDPSSGQDHIETIVEEDSTS